MPTPRPKHRTYCKTCQDFTIHTADYICESCDTKFTPYFPSKVDSNLVEKQRERYTAQKTRDIGGLYGAFVGGFGIDAMMALNELRIEECDAGQKEIDNKRKEQKLEVKRVGQEILEDYNTNYKHLNRNDKCTCGSDKKFKQCHLIYFRKYLKL